MWFMAVLALYVAVRAAKAGSGILAKLVHAAGNGNIVLEIACGGVGVVREGRLHVLPRPTASVAVEAKSLLAPGFA